MLQPQIGKKRMPPFVKLEYIQFEKIVGERQNTGTNQINETRYCSVGII